MKKLWVLVCFIGLSVQLKAQETTTYYLNEREIAPQSFYFLNPEDIDSLKVSLDQISGDSSIVAYTTKEYKILTYDEVLEYFFVEQSASSLTVNTTYCSGVKNTENLVFSIDMIRSVHLITDDFGEKGVFLKPVWLSWQPSSEVEDTMIKIRRKYNHVSSP